MALTYRHPIQTDLDLITSVMNGSRRETAYHRDLTSAEVNTETFEDPDYDPNGAWLAFEGTKAVAYAIGVVEKGRIEAGLDDGCIEIDVLPEERGHGAEEELMGRAVAYLTSRGIAVATARIEQTEGWKTSLHLRYGFKSVRRFYRLARREDASIPSRTMPKGVDVTHKMLREMSDDDVAAFTDVLNDTFAGHFSFAPEPVWRWVKWRDACEDPWMISLATDSSGIIGVCVVEDSKSYNAERGVSTGWIQFLGVRKHLRGQGIGTAMLVDAVRWLQGLGRDAIFIGVDAENEKALGLYESVGFKVENESRAYHLDL